jgi:hypothetical protein
MAEILALFRSYAPERLFPWRHLTDGPRFYEVSYAVNMNLSIQTGNYGLSRFCGFIRGRLSSVHRSSARVTGLYVNDIYRMQYICTLLARHNQMSSSLFYVTGR